MLGTLNGALEVRGIKLPSEAIQADVEGTNELQDGIPLLRRIHVHYTLRVPAGTREVVERALSRHAEKCPTALGLRSAIEVTWSADVSDDGP